MNTEITNAVVAAGDKAQYDTYAKRLLAEKIILAHILVKTVEEFKGMKPEDVVPYIEGEPKVGIVPVEPGLTNNSTNKSKTCEKIVGLNTENPEINEGLIRFDIIFYVRMKNGLSQIIVNVEAQKNEPTEYQIINRAIFYVSRLVSSQKERDFVKTDYDSIKPVSSIWICMNKESDSLSHLHLAKDELLGSCEWEGNMDLINIVLIGLSSKIPEQKEGYELHRLLGTLLSSELSENKKLDILESEYNIPVNNEFREEVRSMCNLSAGIEEKGIKIGIEKGIEKGIAQGIIEGKQKERNDLLKISDLLRGGKTGDELIRMGFDKDSIELALCLRK